MLLDQDSIELTRECEKELNKVSDLKTLRTFLDKYGTCCNDSPRGIVKDYW